MSRRPRRNHSPAFKAKGASGRSRRSRSSSTSTGVLAEAGISISMDGKGAWPDNAIVERLWRTIKYEEVYLHAYDSVSAARERIGRYLDLYNRRRPHSSLDGRTPDEAYFSHESMPPFRLAA